MAFLEVKNLSYTYDKNTPFKRDGITDVSFEIDKGKIVAIIGHTGSGKSTLVQHFNGLLKPDKGTVFLDGKNIWEKPKEINKLRFRVGLVFQYPEYQLFDETVEKDISFGPRNMGLSDDEIKQRVEWASRLVGLNENLLSKSPFDLSGGEKRRAAIAGVIAMRPEILVLDEPTAGLDPLGRELILDRIKDYKKITNASVIIVSHSMEDMARTADEVLVMEHGKIIMFDNVKKVFSKTKELKNAGLDIPEITEIAIQLNKKGFDIDTNIFTVKDMKKALLKLFNKEGCL